MTISKFGNKGNIKPLPDTPYEPTIQGKALNALASTNLKDFDSITHQARATKNGVTITLEDADIFPLDDITHRVLELALIKLARSFPHVPHAHEANETEVNKHRQISISVTEYMKYSGIIDIKTAREQLNNAVCTLYNLNLEWSETYNEFKGKKKIVRTKEYEARILSRIECDTSTDKNNNIVRGIVTIKFDYDIAQYFAQAPTMPYPTNLFKVKLKRNQHALHIGRKMVALYFMNKSKHNACNACNACIVSFKALTDSLPNLPTYEKTKSKSRQYEKRIIKPLERDLDALRDELRVIDSWEYCGAKGKELTDEQINDKSFNGYLQRYIKYTLNTTNLPTPKKPSTKTQQ